MIAALFVAKKTIISREQAISAGLKRYFTGEKCSYGHVSERNVSSYGCLECANVRTARWAKENPEKRKQTNLEQRKKNPAKIAEKKKEWRKANPEKLQAAKQRWSINRRMKLCDFDALLEQQGGKCAICGTKKGFSGGGDNRRLAIDHCHKTQKVRGLLCGNCNRVLGLMKDDPAALRRAADYLEKNQ